MSQQLPYRVLLAEDDPGVRQTLALVRTRFPQVSVIVMTSSSALDGNVPDGVFADATYIKGYAGPTALLDTMSELLQTSVVRETDHVRTDAQALAANQPARRGERLRECCPGRRQNVVRL